MPTEMSDLTSTTTIVDASSLGASAGVGIRPYQMCSRTVMDTTDPEITFDAEGVSNHWYEYQEAARRQLLPAERAEVELRRLVDLMKKGGRGKSYDLSLIHI